VRQIEIFIDEKRFGDVSVPDGATDKDVVAAALKLTSVRGKLLQDGVAAAFVEARQFRVFTRSPKVTIRPMSLGKPLFIESVQGIDVPVFALKK
jgi:hypothetical protein